MHWANAHRLQASLAATLFVLALCIAALAAALLARWVRQPGNRQWTLAHALAALESQQYADALRIATALEQSGRLSTVEAGGPAYVFGVVVQQRAAQLTGRPQQWNYALAASWLARADARGFPPGRQAEAVYRWGQCLYLAGQYEAAIPVLSRGLALNPAQSAEIHGMLAAASARQANPDYAAALAHLASRLDAAEQPPEERDELLVLQAQWQLAAGQTEACRQTLGQLDASSALASEAQRCKAQLEMDHAQALARRAESSGGAAERAEVEAAYRRAIELLRDAQQHDTLANQTTQKAMYLIGVCYLALGQSDAARLQFQRTWGRFHGTPEGFAARWRVGQLLQESGEPAEARKVLAAALGAIDSPQTYSNAWLPLDRLRSEALAAHERFVELRQFHLAVDLAGSLTPLFSRDRVVELTAQTHSAWARALLAEADALAEPEASTRRSLGLDQWRQAGRVYLDLAELRKARREYPDELWNAAQCLRAGHDYLGAADVLATYLSVETRQNRARALVHLGEALLAQGRIQQAETALDRLIDEYPRDTAIFAARLLLASSCADQGRAERAERLLVDNLHSDYLSPASLEWRQSLFDLGSLFYRGGRYLEAIDRLDEALERYPDDARAQEARYQLALCHARQAAAMGAAAGSELIVDQQARYHREAERHWTAALGQFDQVLQVQAQRDPRHAASPLDLAIERNALFGRAGALASLGRYQEAIQAYEEVARRLQGRPEVLDAYVQIVDCYRRLKRPLEARTTIEQARLALQQIKPDADFAATTNFDRAAWGRLLDFLAPL